MPVTLQDAIRRVRALIDEPAVPTLANSIPATIPVPRQFTDTELTDWLNDGLRDVSRRAEDLLTFDQTINVPAFVPTTVSQVPKYTLLPDTIRLHRVEFVPVNQVNQIYRLEASTYNEMDQIWGTYQQNSSSYPRWYVLWGVPGQTTGRNSFQIQLYPCPSQAGTLNVYYYRMPTRIADPVADPSQYLVTLDIVEGWDDMVVDYAVCRAMQKQRNPEWKDRKEEYEQKVADMIDVTRKFHDQQSFVSYGTNNLPAWLVGGGEW